MPLNGLQFPSAMKMNIDSWTSSSQAPFKNSSHTQTTMHRGTTDAASNQALLFSPAGVCHASTAPSAVTGASIATCAPTTPAAVPSRRAESTPLRYAAFLHAT